MRRRAARLGRGLLAVVLLALLGGALYGALGSARDARRHPAPGRLLEAAGATVHVDCRGSGAPAVLVLPGSGSSSLDWRPAQAALATSRRTCVIDPPGLGWSAPAPDDADPVARLHGVAEGLELDAFVLVAHSLGGLTARAYALEHPERLRALVLLDARHEDAAARLPEGLRRAEARQGALLRAAEGLARVGVLRALPGAFVALPPGLPEPLADVYVAHAVRAGPYRAMRQRMRSLTALAERVRGRALAVPLVVVRHGRADVFAGLREADAAEAAWRAMQAELAATSPRAELRVAEGAGHNLHLEAPGAVAEAVRAALRLADGAGPP